MKPLISVIVPVYNVERYLSNCLDSLIGQTYENWEAILVDDGSPDACGILCDEYAKKDSRFHVIHQENGGVSSARNMGLDGAKGEYVCFVDPDDRVMPTYLEQLLQAMGEGESDLAVCGYEKKWLKNDEMIRSMKKTDAPNGFFVDFSEELTQLHMNTLLFMPWNKLYKFSLIREHQLVFPNQKRYEDTVFVYRYLQHCNAISFCNEVLYCYCHYTTERTTATTQFTPKLYEAYQLVYQEGIALVQCMKQKNMTGTDVFLKEVKKHYFSSIGGDLVPNLGRSHLSYRQRLRYVKSVLSNLPAETDGITFEGRSDRIIYFFVIHRAAHALIWLSYLYTCRKRRST